MREYMHSDLAEWRWDTLSLAEQMGNVGSEISRAIRWKNKSNEKRMEAALDRALELIDLSIQWAQKSEIKISHPGAIREFCRLREVVCDRFFGHNDYLSDDEAMQRYFDRFAIESKQ